MSSNINDLNLVAPAWIKAQATWASHGRRETWAELCAVWREQRLRWSGRESVPVVRVLVRESGQSADLQRTLQSVDCQSYPNVRAVCVPESESLPIDLAGDWVGYLEAGEILSPVAVASLVAESEASPSDFLYSNECHFGDSLSQLDYLSKSEWNLFDLLHFNAVGRLWLLRGELWRAGQGLAGENWERVLFLSLYQTGARLRFVSQFLCLRPRQMAERDREPTSHGDLFSAVLPTGVPRVSAIICFRNSAEWTIRSAESLLGAATGVELELLLVNNGSTDAQRALVAERAETWHVPFKLIDDPRPFNFARMHNDVIKQHARGELLLLLNNDVFLEGHDALFNWARWATVPWIGTVGILLRRENGVVQHAGLRAFFGGSTRAARIGHEEGSHPYALQSRRVFGSSFAACLIRRELFDQVGGLNELLYPNGFGDVAFNLELHRRGMVNVFLSSVSGIHLESASRGMRYEYWEEMAVESRYGDQLVQMLREDRGLNRVPASSVSFMGEVKKALAVALRERAAWFDYFQQWVRKWQRLRHAGLPALRREWKRGTV